MRKLIFGLMLFPITVFVTTGLTADKDSNWPGFRGTNSNGIADGYDLPVEWNVEQNKNVYWQKEIPGLSHASPVIWNNKLFILTSVSGKENDYLKVGLYGNIDPVEDDSSHRWYIYCLQKQSGEIIWEKMIYEGVPKIKRHTKATHANSTPVTDGSYVAAFLGSEGLYCYNMDGDLVWKKDLGTLDSGFYVVPEAQWGFASSPVIYKDMVFVQCDVQQNSFVAAFELQTGKEIWRTPRQEVPTWSTPAIVESGGMTQLVANGYKHIGGYDALTGTSLWWLTGGGDIPVPTPIFGFGLIFIANAHGKMAPLYAIKTDAVGDISLEEGEKKNQYIAWSTSGNGAYMQTPIIYGDYLYSSRDNGVIKCYEPKTGERFYQKRMGTGRTGFSASPVAGDGKLYFTSEEGDIFVLKAGKTFEEIAVNAMNDICMATPAISEGALYFRTRSGLIAIKEK